MIVTEISSVIELSQGLSSRKMTAIVYFLSLSIRIQGNQDSPRPRSTKLDDSCPHDPQEWGKQGRTDHWPTDSFGVCLWGRGKAGSYLLTARFLGSLAGGLSPEAETGQAPAGSLRRWVCQQRSELGPGAVYVSELMTQSLAQGETAESRISAGQDRYQRTRKRESPGQRWEGMSLVMSCRLLSQNEQEALGQELRKILEHSSLLKSTGKLQTTKTVRRITIESPPKTK